MQAAQDYTAYKAQLEDRVANLRRDREAAMREVESLNLKVAVRELERQAKALEGELEGLKGKKTILEQKLASLDTPQHTQPAQQAQQRPAARQVSQ